MNFIASILMESGNKLSADIIIKIIFLILGIIGFILGYRQYKKGQGWQKADIIINLIDSFEIDKRIEAACFMLDWDSRKVEVNGMEIDFENKMLVDALIVPMDDSDFSREQQVIRDAFDAFFDFFEKPYTLVESRLLDFSEIVGYWDYWFELLRRVGAFKKEPIIQERINNYVEKYGFIGIRELLKEYNKNPNPLLEEYFKEKRVLTV